MTGHDSSTDAGGSLGDLDPAALHGVARLRRLAERGAEVA